MIGTRLFIALVGLALTALGVFMVVSVIGQARSGDLEGAAAAGAFGFSLFYVLTGLLGLIGMGRRRGPRRGARSRAAIGVIRPATLRDRPLIMSLR